MMETERLKSGTEVFKICSVSVSVPFDVMENIDLIIANGNGGHVNGVDKTDHVNGASDEVLISEEVPDSSVVIEQPQLTNRTEGDNGGHKTDETESPPEKEEVQASGSSEEDLPLAVLLSANEARRSQTPTKAACPSTSKSQVEPPVKSNLLSPVHPFLHVRGRPGLRSGSPLNKSFTVRSEPSTPSGFEFPSLRKAAPELNLFEAADSRKRKLDDTESCEKQVEDNKRQRTSGWWGLESLTRWWGSTTTESDVTLEPSQVEDGDDSSQDSASKRSCVVM